MLQLGLAPNSNLLTKMFSLILNRPMSCIHNERIALKDFQKLYSSNRLVSRILKVLNDSIQMAKQKRRKLVDDFNISGKNKDLLAVRIASGSPKKLSVSRKAT